MRTTLTFDPDVAASLKRLRQRDPRSFKALVNDLLRKGLEQLDAKPPARRAPHRTRGATLGACRIGNLDDVSEAIAVAEGEPYR